MPFDLMLMKGYNHKCIHIPQSYNIWCWLFNYVCDRNSNWNENIVRRYFPLIMNLETHELGRYISKWLKIH